MGIFDKKYDIEKDRLRVVFNIQSKSYDVYYGSTLLSYSKLNRKSRKYIENENHKLRTNDELLNYEIEKVMTKKRFDKLKSLGYSCDSFEYLGPVNGTMSKEIETLLNKLVMEEDVLLGIHRIGSDDSIEKIEDILKNGLKITGHFGVVGEEYKALKNNVGYYPNNKTIIKELMYADNYKNSRGSILVRIPDEDLRGKLFVVDENGETRLNPKYIVGYVPIYDKHHLEKVITLESLIKNNSSYGYTFSERENNEQSFFQELEHKVRR